MSDTNNYLDAVCVSVPMCLNRFNETCMANATAIISAASVSETTMDALDLWQPQPHGQSCTVTSIVGPEWTFSYWYIYANMVGNDVSGEIDILNSGLGASWVTWVPDQRPHTIYSKPNQWYNGTEDDTPADGLDLQYQLDFENGYMNIQETWTCHDKDPNHQYVI
jgi:hypothetical protein